MSVCSMSKNAEDNVGGFEKELIESSVVSPRVEPGEMDQTLFLSLSKSH